MAICIKCGKTYYSKVCPYCNNLDIKQEELKEIEELKEKQRKIIKKAKELNIKHGGGNVNAEYNRKVYKKILNNKIKDKNFLFDLEKKDPRLKKGKIVINKKENNKTIIYSFIGLLIILITLLIYNK